MSTCASPAAHLLRTRPHRLFHRWPAALGLSVAGAALATGADRESVATVTAVAALCYLAAAATGRRWIAWATIPGGTGVVMASEAAGVPWWIGVGVTALVLVAVGVGGRQDGPALTAQTAALLGFGGTAVAALFVVPRAGLALAGAVLASHAIWDAVHYRKDRVVGRSLAEFCMWLDVPLGLGCVVLAVLG